MGYLATRRGDQELQTSGSKGTGGEISQAEEGVYCSGFHGESISEIEMLM